MTPAPEEYQNNPEELSVHEEKKRMYKMIRGNSIDFKNKFMNQSYLNSIKNNPSKSYQNFYPM